MPHKHTKQVNIQNTQTYRHTEGKSKWCTKNKKKAKQQAKKKKKKLLQTLCGGGFNEKYVNYLGGSFVLNDPVRALEANSVSQSDMPLLTMLLGLLVDVTTSTNLPSSANVSACHRTDFPRPTTATTDAWTSFHSIHGKVSIKL